jgi:hypothetical protein
MFSLKMKMREATLTTVKEKKSDIEHQYWNDV